ncbi:thermonuclease family protein [Yersinia enterocolitica]|uniref:thermonuclease family protein n=1 Tax=Yersiniaceae TaxID=1903411 RepID=UPI001B2B2D06|nr:micrococcal nuclease [Escherichia coli]EKN3891420.1 thermonuclease family protein [Yersinia enterocolitica]HBE9082580.1 thermonuclease family protein [Serratia fonticola]EKN3944465.1 thermonuclease family protein [Yersinia enterocolitica]EKN4176342.1 thermonuclease family protein [Yersinia enterocolitica]
MTLIRRIGILLNKIITLTFCFFLSGSLVAAEIQGKVIRVLDGDTIDVLQDKKPVRVRLLNIDAPEKKQAYGSWSTNQLKDLVAGQPVTVTYTQKDRYGRVLGRVVTTNGTEANRYMVQSGAAWVYERYNTDNALPALQREAQEQKRGLWAESHPVPPWEWRHNK